MTAEEVAALYGDIEGTDDDDEVVFVKYTCACDKCKGVAPSHSDDMMKHGDIKCAGAVGVDIAVADPRLQKQATLVVRSDKANMAKLVNKKSVGGKGAAKNKRDALATPVKLQRRLRRKTSLSVSSMPAKASSGKRKSRDDRALDAAGLSMVRRRASEGRRAEVYLLHGGRYVCGLTDRTRNFEGAMDILKSKIVGGDITTKEEASKWAKDFENSAEVLD